ncbi:MAG TPA: hypothetical protein VLF66_12100 [Thermoanaerobaculia bacterium]|nr:hypothetical protein [Thermoanaerobaculia bacterium]
MTSSLPWLDLDYAIDGAGRIVRVGKSWDRVAVENGAPGLVAAHVLDSLLGEHISDAPSRHLWEVLTDRVRETGESRTVPIRCDTPALRRWIRVVLIPAEAGGVIFHTRLERVEPRPHLALLDASGPRDPSRLLRLCSWCKRAAVEGRGWLELEEAAERLGLLEERPVPEITHGLCEDCEARMLGRAV